VRERAKARQRWRRLDAACAYPVRRYSALVNTSSARGSGSDNNIVILLIRHIHNLS